MRAPTAPWWTDPARVLPPLALALWPAYPPLDWPAAAWLGVAPLALALHLRAPEAGAWNPLRWVAGAWGYGLVFYAGHFLWLHAALVGMAGMPLARALGLGVTVVATLALFPAVMLLGVRAAWRGWGWSPLWTLPAGWSLWEAAMGVVPFGGIPWGALAATQALTPLAAWVVPWAGSPALAGLLAATGCATAGALAWAVGWVLRRGPGLRGAWRLVLPAALLALATAPLVRPTPWTEAQGGQRFEVLLVPGDLGIPFLQRTRDTPEAVRHYIGRTLGALGGRLSGEPGPPLLVAWPESAYSGHVEQGKTLVDLARLARLLDAGLLLGSDARVLGRQTNALYLVPAGPFDFVRYDKRQLVPFGEYVPAGFRWLTGPKVTSGTTDYAAGTNPPVLGWQGRTLGMAVCFESTLPLHVWRTVAGGAGVLVAAANDAWLSPAAARHHLRLSALRALEAGRPLVFVANRGWSGIVQPDGRHTLLPPGAAPHREAVLPRQGRTPWHRGGMGLWLAGVAGCLAVALVTRRRRRGGLSC